MKKPTEKQIEAEIKKLTEMKPNVRRTSAFGDNHWAAIDAQVRVLTERMDEDMVFDEFPDRDNEDGVAENIQSAARDAAEWMEGESEYGSPSKGWKELLIK